MHTRLQTIARTLDLVAETTGRVVRFNRFLDMDQDQSNSISPREFVARARDESSAMEQFVLHDRNRNDAISFPEFAHFSMPNFLDPIEWFRGADMNLDAQLVDGHRLVEFEFGAVQAVLFEQLRA